ncbi:MAG: TerB family tellurite resistance protein [Gemmobacter sp.]|nr:TerB family tellurite resistance protein [Gemmobacter sp.]
MVKGLLKRLATSGPVAIPADEARIALAALLVRVARADGVYDAVEMARIDRVLMGRFGMDARAAAILRAEAEAPDTVRFTRVLKDAVPLDDRIGLIEAMWAVVLADGTRDVGEDRMMRMVAPLLGVSDLESGLARQRMDRKGL